MTDHPLGFLVGVWRGEGRGEYPTIEPFSYGEEIEFTAIPGKPFLRYTQRTWNLESNAPMHAECGYWRPAGAGAVEIVLAHPTGIVEIQEGSVGATTVDVTSKVVAATTTAVEVAELARTLSVEGGVLRYEVRMAAAGQPLTLHLSAELHRV